MELVLKPETEAILQKALKSGRFADADALIAKAVEVLSDNTPEGLDHLDDVIQVGIDSAESEPLYGEEEARTYLASARKTWK